MNIKKGNSMIQKIKTHFLLLTSTLLMTIAPLAIAPATSYAVCNDIGNQVSRGANGAAENDPSTTCGTSTGVADNDIARIANQIVNIFSIIVGAVAVIMIIYGGFRYITSGGDSNRVGSAKNTLIYAIIGLIIVALAQIIVHFVLNATSNAVPNQ
jgi:hypothetical protein